MCELRCSHSAVDVYKWVAPKPSDSNASPLTGAPRRECVCVSISVFSCFVSPSWLTACESKSLYCCFDLLTQYLLCPPPPTLPSTSIVLAKYERDTDTVQWLSLIAHQPETTSWPPWGVSCMRCCWRETHIENPFLLQRRRSYAWLDWLLWAWDSGCIALCLMCLKGSSWS